MGQNKFLRKINKLLFVFLLITLGVTFFTRNNYRAVEKIHPDLLKDPIQTELNDPQILTFRQEDYEYELTPLYAYEINAFVVHKMDYTLFSIYKRDSVFPLDLCLLWGENVQNRVYQSKNLKFGQDMRFCSYRYSHNLQFNGAQFSNSHLVVQDEIMEKQLKQISRGDQVKIQGKLVNIKAQNLGDPGEFDPGYFELKSSISREDTGQGACEIILLENIEIIQKSNPLSHLLYKMSAYALLVLIGINIVSFVMQIARH